MARLRSTRCAVGATLLAALASASAASAHLPDAKPTTSQLYWANTGTDSIGRVSLIDPTNADHQLLPGATDPRGLAIDGSYVYWAHDAAGGSIGRGNFDGTGLDHSFLRTGGTPHGIALAGNHVWWTQVMSGSGFVGRALLGGFDADQDLFSTGPAPCGLVITDRFAFWANSGAPGSIARAPLAGGPVDQGFIPAADPCGIAITQEHIYWANRNPPSIGRANLDGTAVDQAYLPLTSAPCGVAVDGADLYYTAADGSIGRVRLSDKNVEPFVTGTSNPCGIAVAASVAVTPAGTAFPPTEVGKRSSPRGFLIQNTSSSSLDTSTLNTSRGNVSDFQIGVDTCTDGLVPPAGTCRLTVRFTPKRAGDRATRLRMSGNASNHPFEIPLAGKALPDRTKPRVQSANVRPRLVGRGRRATLRYRLSEPGRVALAVERRRGRGFRRVGRLGGPGKAGANTRRLPRSIGGRVPPAGRYRVRVVATDRAGNPSRPRFAVFRVVG